MTLRRRVRPSPSELAGRLAIFFDVDHTLIDDDGNLRPGARAALAELTSRGHQVHLWSGLGPRWEVVERHDLRTLIAGCHTKPLYQHEAMLEPLGIPVRPDFVVDDHPHLVAIFGGCVVRPYRNHDPDDREMSRVIGEVERIAVFRRAQAASKTRTGSAGRGVGPSGDLSR